MKIAFIGLGVMGAPMAGHLLQAGHELTVFNRTQSKSEAWVNQHGGQLAPSPMAAAENVELVISCIGYLYKMDNELEPLYLKKLIQKLKIKKMIVKWKKMAKKSRHRKFVLKEFCSS